MQTPWGKAGKTLIAEVSRLIGLFNHNKKWQPAAIHMLQVFLPLLYSWSHHSNEKTENLSNTWTKEWNGGNMQSYKNWSQRVGSYSNKTQKIGQIQDDINGKYEITTDIITKLKEKHPQAAKLKQSAIIDKPETKTKKVIFENITQDEIASNTKNASGSEEPTQIGMGTWREMIFSKSHGIHSQTLAEEIATLARPGVSRRTPFHTITYQLSSHADMFY